MSERTVEVDGQPWQDGWVGVDRAGVAWRLDFVASSWGPVYDRWVWRRFGDAAEQPLESEVVSHPLTKVWPLESTPDAALAEKPVKRRTS